MSESCVVVETGAAPQYAVIWLHGLGADGHDFEPLVPQLVQPDGPSLRFVFPHAPIRPISINGGMRMRAWYDIYGFGPDAPQDEIGMGESTQRIGQLIQEQAQHGIAEENIFLAGFSQGGAVAISTALRYPQRLAGLIALSTYLANAKALAGNTSAANASLPVFMAHGQMDPVLPYLLGITARDTLQALGHTVDWHAYSMAHQVISTEITDLRAWLVRRVQGDV